MVNVSPYGLIDKMGLSYVPWALDIVVTTGIKPRSIRLKVAGALVQVGALT